MASQVVNSPKNRRCRKIPSVQNPDDFPSGSSIFWYSYQSALHWMRRHEDIISQCVQLLQAYPSLIQDSSMDHFWEFIEPFIARGNTEKKNQKNMDVEANRRVISASAKTRDKPGVGKGPEIPYISVTESNDSPAPFFTISAKHARTPRVHLISHVHKLVSQDDRRLHMGVIEMLQEDFYIRVASPRQISLPGQTNPASASSQRPPREYIISESDICVYLFNDATLEDRDCFHDLCMALNQKFPIVYVRCHDKDLPKTFSDTVQKNSNGCVTLKNYADKFLKETSTLQKETTATVKNIRSKKKLPPLTLKSRPSSATDLSFRGTTESLVAEKRKHSPVHLELDLLFTLVSNFKSACVYDENDLVTCAAKLKHTIHRLLGIYDNKSELPSFSQVSIDSGTTDELCLSSPDSVIGNSNPNHNNRYSLPSTPAKTSGKKPSLLSVPDPDDIISTREWGTSGSISAPPHGQPNRNYDLDGGGHFFFGTDVQMVRSLSSEQKSTTYLVFDHAKSPEGPLRVDFPLRQTDSTMMESDADSDENESSTSPIGFQDIDLSREINASETPESDVSSVASYG